MPIWSDEDEAELQAVRRADEEAWQAFLAEQHRKAAELAEGWREFLEGPTPRPT